jgi:hypothetical protein
MSEAASKTTTPSVRYVEPEKYDRPPAGWFALNVMRAGDGRKWDWVGLMVDVDPNELKYCLCDFPAAFFINPYDWHPAEGRKARQCYVPVPGKHRNQDAAWDALHDAIDASLN